MTPHLGRRLEALAGDRVSGASRLLPEAVALLQEARAGGEEVLLAVARGICRAQPAMAPLWNAAMLALVPEADRLAAFASRAARGTQVVARFATEILALRPPDRAAVPLRVVTFSASGVVQACLEALAARNPLRVACAESRPAGEGRHLAAALAARGIAVELYTDAGTGGALEGADALLVGADAVAERWFLNKAGTRALCASAAQQGVAVLVAAARDKYASPPLAARLAGREGPPAEVWADPPAGVTVRNPYFEAVPADLVASFLSDAGPLDLSGVAGMCRRQPWDERLA